MDEMCIRKRAVLRTTSQFLTCIWDGAFTAMETSEGQSRKGRTQRFGKEYHELSFEHVQFEISVKEMVLLL